MSALAAQNALQPLNRLADTVARRGPKDLRPVTAETPTELADFEFIRWYLLHGRATVFTEDGDWYLLVHTECKHLQPDNRCGIYETRPQICREYSTDNCEYEDEWTYEQYFETPEQVHEYAEALMGPKRGQSIRSPKPKLLPVL